MPLAPAERVRINALPEGFAYPDNGCDLAPSCLHCTLPTCRHDLPQGAQSLRVAQNRLAVARLHHQGLTVHQIAARLDLGWRSVFRYLKAIREGRVKLE